MQPHATRRAVLGTVAAMRWGGLTLLIGVAAHAGCHPPSSAPPTPPVLRDLGDIHGESKLVTWTCVGAACPWGASVTGQALVWPDAARAVTTRLGYTVSGAMYLPAAAANGATISSETGALRIYAGLPGDDIHRLLATVTAGKTFRVAGLAGREVLSVQGDTEFKYRATLPPVREPAPDAAPGRVMQGTKAFWRCNFPGCRGSDWTGAAVGWPPEVALQSNGRYGDASRSVFAGDGTPLYPYMGPWAHGCKVTVESGVVQIIEWRRGSDTWREIWLFPGQSHVIELGAPEDSAMLESYDGSPGFTVSVARCTPQPIQP